MKCNGCIDSNCNTCTIHTKQIEDLQSMRACPILNKIDCPINKQGVKSEAIETIRDIEAALHNVS